MKEEYASIKIVLKRLQYHVHKLLICADLKIVNFFWVSKEVTQNTLIFYAIETVEL